jgi:hypothetical protein
VGVTNDVIHLWNDLQTDIKNLVDVGLMAKLHLAHKYSLTSFNNLSLKTSVEDVLGLTLDKEPQTSDWKSGELSDAQRDCALDSRAPKLANISPDAAIDAIAPVLLYQVLAPALVKRQEEMRITIPENWYTVNGKYGYMFRKNNNFWGKEVQWTAKDCYWFVGDKFQGYT